MKALKKSVAFVLAVLMIFSSMSALGYAAMDDGNRDSFAITSEFLRYDEATDSWVKTEKAARGDKVKVQLTIQTNYAAGCMDLLWEFTKSNLAVDTTVHTANGTLFNDVVNDTAGTITGDYGYSGDMNIVTDGYSTTNNSIIQWLVEDGLLTEEFTETYGFIVHTIADFKSYPTICQVLPGDAWMYEYYFTVDENATGEGKLFLEPSTIQDVDAGYMGYVNIPRALVEGVSTVEQTSEMYNWMPSPAINNVTLNHGSITFDNTITFEKEKNVIATQVVLDENGDPVLDAEGNETYEYVVDSEGNPVYVQAKDEDGNLLYEEAKDENGKIIYEQEVDAEGNPVVDEDGNPVYTTNPVMVPVYEKETYTVNGTADYSGYIGDAANITVPTASASGKAFLGWSIDGMNILPDEEIEALKYDYEPTTLVAMFEPADATYTENIYLMGTDGKYPDAPTETDDAVSASAGDVITAAEDYAAAPEGFTLDKDNSTEEITVAEDGSSVMNIYYSRNKYNLTFDAKDGAWADGSKTQSSDVYYGAAVTVAEAPDLEGMKFTSWSWSKVEEVAADDGTTSTVETPLDAAPATMPAYNVKATAQYESAETTVAIKVKYNDLANGGAEKIVDHATVTTIAGYTVALAAADEGAENTAYYLVENLPEITHYEYDAAATTKTVTAAADGSSVIYAVYKPLTYTATFEGAETFADVAYYTEITVPAGPVVAGKTFTGWLGSDGSTPAVGSTLNIAGDVTYTAQYDDIIYKTTVSFNGEEDVDYPADAVVPTVASGIKGDEIVLADPDPVTGWTFDGWTVTGATKTGDKYYYNTSDVTVKGSWTHEIYTVTYYLDQAKTEEYDVQEYYYGDMIELLDAPDASVLPAGKEFVEWDCGYASMPAENIDVVATLNPIQYTISITLPEGYDSVTYSAYYGDTITAEELAEYEELEGWTFNGWVINGKAATLPYTIVGNTGVRGDFTKNKWDLYFWADEDAYNAFVAGEATSDDAYKFVADVEYDSAIDTLTPVNPTKEGHTFVAWDMEPTTMEDNDMHFYGIWDIESYTVVWDNDGEKTTVTDVAYGSVLEIPAPVKTGYTLKGWSGLTVAEEGDTTMPDNNYNDGDTVTFTAVWEANTYDAVFMSDGEVYETVPTKFGADIIAPTAPTKDGYLFGGWEPAVGKMDSVDGKIFNAIWNADTDTTYTIETYTMDATGAYGEPVKTTKTGATDSDVDATPATIEKGFKIDTAKSELTGKVKADNSLVLKVYLARETYTLTTVVDGGEPVETPYLYGATVSVTTPSKEGYSFAWDKEVPATMPAENVTLTGTFTALQYDLVYMVDGKQHSTEKVTFGTEVTVIAPLTKEGYTFSGWDKTGTFTMPAETVTISGTFTVNTHDVIYMVDGEEYDRVEDVAYGTPVTVIDDLKEDGKVFSGWTIDGAEAADFTMPDKDVTIVGSWTTSNYTVTYYTDKDKATTHYTYTGAYGANYNVPVDPEKDGHKFLGWAKVADDAAAGLPEAGTITTVPLGGAEYYATWETLSYKLVYAAGTNATFSDGTTQKTYDVPYGTAQADWDVPTETLTRPGYTFGGWDLTGAPATMGAAPVRVNAIWNAIPYTVTWINGDAEPVVDDYIYGEEIIAPVLEDREGWTFEGWLEADGETYFSEGDTMGEKSLVYTAKWTGNEGVEYTIYRYFAPVDGEDWMDAAEAEAKYGKAGSTVETGTAGELAEVDTAAEAVAGFTIDTENSTLSATIKGDGSTVLVIYYLRDKVNVTVKDPDGETYYDGEVDFEDEITVPDPEKEGHDFIGWVDEDGETVTFPMAAPSEDIVIKPVFQKKTYTITFVDDNGDVIEAAKEVEYGSTIVAPADPEKDGFNFAYWVDSETGAVMPATMPAKNATYKAYYTAGEDTTYYIEVYMMDTSGEYTMASRTVATGTTGDPISITPGTIKGCTYDATLSVLTGVITADGESTLKVYYARNKYTVTFNAGDGVFADNTAVAGPTEVLYGAAVPTPAAPTREGYNFTGWDAEVPAAMPADNLTFNATWEEAEYTITYVVNGTKEVVPYKFGATVATPEDPEVAGMTFIKWDTAIPATMPAEDLIIIAVFEVAVYKATFIVDGVVYEEFMVGHGDEIPVPAEDPKKDFYTFKGWSNMPDDGRMPAVDIEITATFERVPVKLIPMAGSTTVIDADTMAITGIGRYATEATLRSTFLDVEGDGYFTVTPSKKTACGTGTVIELYDNVTGELLETYTIVVYGDLNGDSRIGNDDYSIAQAEYDMVTSWSDPASSEYDFYKTMAADFDGDTMINIGEAADIGRFVLGTVDIDQITGEIIRLK